MLLLALAWRRIRSLAFNSAETLIAMAADAVATLQATGSATDMWLDHLRRLVEHRRILLLAARDDMIGVERRAEKLLAEFGDDQPYLSCALLAQLMASRRELYHFHDTLRLEAETRRALQRPGSDFASIALKSSVAPTLMAQGKMMAAEAMLEEALDARPVHPGHPPGTGGAAGLAAGGAALRPVEPSTCPAAGRRAPAAGPPLGVHRPDRRRPLSSMPGCWLPTAR